MSIRKYKAEQIVTVLRQIEVQMATGKDKREPKSAQKPVNRKKDHMRETSYETGNDDMQRLRALVPFLSKFEAPGFKFGHVCSFFDSDLSPVALDFVSTCYKSGWIGKDFDGTEWEGWGDWKESDEARRLRDDPGALDSATTGQLGRLLTVLIRQDRFVTGALIGAFESGLLVRILRRVAVLASRPST